MISYNDQNDELNILECHPMHMKQNRTEAEQKQNRTILWEPNWPEGPVHEDQTGPKDQYIRTNWPEASVHEDQTGLNGQYIDIELLMCRKCVLTGRGSNPCLRVHSATTAVL